MVVTNYLQTRCRWSTSYRRRPHRGPKHVALCYVTWLRAYLWLCCDCCFICYNEQGLVCSTGSLKYTALQIKHHQSEKCRSTNSVIVINIYQKKVYIIRQICGNCIHRMATWNCEVFRREKGKRKVSFHEGLILASSTDLHTKKKTNFTFQGFLKQNHVLWFLCLQCFNTYSETFCRSFEINLLPRNEIVLSTPNTKDNLLEKFSDNLYDIKS